MRMANGHKCTTAKIHFLSQEVIRNIVSKLCFDQKTAGCCHFLTLTLVESDALFLGLHAAFLGIWEQGIGRRLLSIKTNGDIHIFC